MNASSGIHGVASSTRPASVDRPQGRDLLPVGRLQVALDTCPTSVGQARGITKAFMQKWTVPKSLEGDMQLVVSELVTNAALHSGTDEIILTLALRAGRFWIDVHDGVPNHRPSCRTPSPDEEHGRGLQLVEWIAAQWDGGWGVSHDGTTTWCFLSIALEDACKR